MTTTIEDTAAHLIRGRHTPASEPVFIAHYLTVATRAHREAEILAALARQAETPCTTCKHPVGTNPWGSYDGPGMTPRLYCTRTCLEVRRKQWAA